MQWSIEDFFYYHIYYIYNISSSIIYKIKDIIYDILDSVFYNINNINMSCIINNINTIIVLHNIIMHYIYCVSIIHNIYSYITNLYIIKSYKYIFI